MEMEMEMEGLDGDDEEAIKMIAVQRINVPGDT
jgi:hypothetical protein